jgi:hypothetical protein
MATAEEAGDFGRDQGRFFIEMRRRTGPERQRRWPLDLISRKDEE